MSISRVLQVKRTEIDAGSVLLNVTAQNATSLDLDIKATEGTTPYGSQVANNQVSNLRSSNYKGNEEEWQIILRWVLLGTSPSSTYQTLIEQVELVATVAADSEITLTIRQNIVGITHRLGSIRVPYDETVEIELFDWNLIATNDRDGAERKVQDLQQRFDEQQKTLNKLNTQLQELIEAKKRHEDELLEKFRHVLNSKKAKIRDQMRLLSTAKVDRTTAKKVRTTRAGSDTPAPAGRLARKAGKRKAVIDEDVNEEVYQEPKMADEDTDTDRDITHTPDQNTSETETDEGEGQGSEDKPQSAKSKLASHSQAKARSPSAAAPARKTTTRASTSRRPADDESSDSGFEAAPMSQSQSSRVKVSQVSHSHERQKTPPELPPKRELPFGNGRQVGKIAATPAANTKKKEAPVIDDDETDDEL